MREVKGDEGRGLSKGTPSIGRGAARCVGVNQVCEGHRCAAHQVCSDKPYLGEDKVLTNVPWASKKEKNQVCLSTQVYFRPQVSVD